MCIIQQDDNDVYAHASVVTHTDGMTGFVRRCSWGCAITGVTRPYDVEYPNPAQPYFSHLSSIPHLSLRMSPKHLLSTEWFYVSIYLGCVATHCTDSECVCVCVCVLGSDLTHTVAIFINQLKHISYPHTLSRSIGLATNSQPH